MFVFDFGDYVRTIALTPVTRARVYGRHGRDRRRRPGPRSRVARARAPQRVRGVGLGVAFVQLGRTDEAIARLEHAVAAGQRHPSVLETLGYAYAAAGRRPAALSVVDQLPKAAPGRFGFALPIARIHAALGDADRAFAWLRKACDERTPFVIWLEADPTFDVLRTDWRFAPVLREMGLPTSRIGSFGRPR